MSEPTRQTVPGEADPAEAGSLREIQRAERQSTLWTIDSTTVSLVNRLVEDSGPLEIEIGCGKGWFAIARAEQCSHLHVLGLDRADRYLRRGRRRIRHRRLTNVTLLKADARLILARCIPAERISAFHIYFPDPWPKRRHRHRRLMTAGFLADLHDRLLPGGVVEFATDVAPYLEEVVKASDACGVAWQQIRRSLNHRLFVSDVMSGYEQKCLVNGRPIYYLELRK